MSRAGTPLDNAVIVFITNLSHILSYCISFILFLYGLDFLTFPCIFDIFNRLQLCSFMKMNFLEYYSLLGISLIFPQALQAILINKNTLYLCK